MIERMIRNHTAQTIQDCREVLETQNIRWESDITYSIIIYNSIDDSYTNPIATGSFSGSVIKCVAVTPLFEGVGLAQRIITLLLEELYERETEHIFLFTRPKNIQSFRELGFHPTAVVDDTITLMEQNQRGLQNFCEGLKKQAITSDRKGPVSCLVMNCNPFTNGHRYIIEQASEKSSVLYVFIVTEDSSEFPTDVRIELIRKGTQDLKNVKIFEGGEYIISRNTFPTYFLKSQKIIDQAYAQLDALIFAEHIAPALGIEKRFVGNEPFCPVTDNYNTQLAQILPQYGITLEVIDRLEYEHSAVSASEVRRLFVQQDYGQIAKIVPETTLSFLRSDRAQYIREIIQRRSSKRDEEIKS